MVTLGLKLFLAHVLGDFVFQPDRWVKGKTDNKHKSKHLYLHIAIHALMLLLLLKFDVFYWKAFLTIIVSHLIIDITKTHLYGRVNKKALFWLDQLAHSGFILLAVYLYEPYAISLQPLFTNEVMLFLVATICVTFVSSIIIKQSLSSWGLEAREASRGKSSQQGNRAKIRNGFTYPCWQIHWLSGTAVPLLLYFDEPMAGNRIFNCRQINFSFQ